MRFWAEWVAQNTLKMDYNCIVHSTALTISFDCDQSVAVKGVGESVQIEMTDCFSYLCFL